MLILASFGTTEVVPFQNLCWQERSSAPVLATAVEERNISLMADQNALKMSRRRRSEQVADPAADAVVDLDGIVGERICAEWLVERGMGSRLKMKRKVNEMASVTAGPRLRSHLAGLLRAATKTRNDHAPVGRKRYDCHV